MRTSETVRISPARRKWLARDHGASRLVHCAARRQPWLVATLVGVSRLSDGVLWYVVMLALPWVGGARGIACALRMLCLGAVNLAVYKVLKKHFARPRPYVTCPEILACTRCLDEYSFPSGHTLYAVGFGVLLTAYYPALGLLVWPFVVLVALSRIVLGLHYPSDVIAGAAIGWFMAESVLVLF
jgi:undecaprenyl-diphosphatase